MSSLAPNELVDFLTRHQVLGESHLEALGREVDRYQSIVQMTDELVARGWLSKHQQSLLVSGQGEKLILGPYRLVEPIGEGGMGMVYKGWHPKLDRFVALKLIRPQVLATRPEIITRFHREARAIAQLHHPNIVVLYDADETDGTHYIAMEFVDGVTLEKMVRQNGPLGIKQACDYMRQSALGLQHASECNLVHRDIKPSNILVAQKTTGGKRSSAHLKRPALVTVRDRELTVDPASKGRAENAWGVVKILDMGLARLQESLEDDESSNATPLTRAGALLGTPDFISPEQARDARSVDIRADLYSLGCTFYYILTGRPPFPGGNDVQKLIKHQNEKPFPIDELRPHMPNSVVAVVQRLMAKKPEDRYQSAQDLADAMSDYLASAASPQTPPRGLMATQAPLETPSPIPQSPYVHETPIPLADLTDGFDSDVERDLMEAPTAMLSELPQSKEVNPSALLGSHTGVVCAVALSADGRYAASGGVDGKIRVWDLGPPQPREVAVLPRPSTEIQALAFAPDDPLYLVYGGTVAGKARLQRWDWSENKVYDWGGFETTDHRGIGCVAFSPDGSMFAAGVGSFAVSWKVHRRTANSRNILKGMNTPIRSLTFSSDHRLLVTSSEGKSIRFWGFGWLGTSLKASVQAHADSITSMAFSPDSKRLATVGLDRQVVLWDPLTPSENSAIVLAGHTNDLRHVQFLSGGKHLVSVGESGEVFFWDVQTSHVIQDFLIDLKMMYCVAMSADAKRLVAGYSNGKVALYDLQPNLSKAAPSTAATAGKY